MWPKYLIRKNFLSSEHLEALQAIKWTTPDDGWEILTPQIQNGQFLGIKFRGLPEYPNATMPTNIPSADLFMDMYAAYQPIMRAALQKLAPEKLPYHVWTETQIIHTGKDYSFKIHNDSTSKLLSTVTYLSPEPNIGTILYDNEQGDNPREVEWENNKFFAFSRNQDTWHSYKANGINSRLALVYTLRGRLPENIS